MEQAAIERVRLIFTLFDADGSGSLEPEDFDLMATRVVAAAPESGETARAAVLAAFRRYWTTLAAELDVNRDGKITFEEFSALVLSPERFSAALAEFAEALAALGDPDGDGLVERERFVALMTAIGFARPNIDALFDAFQPADDKIAASIWTAGIRDYYSPDKAGIAGDRLVVTPG
ncbi:EF-hand domain-containing protein [Actinocorallia sp. A-T 12471]|uniref:EF-hand domain-containing protein n=1 Tax=Actinocorallia sp. A-T 12471 TaxID=3089813 RepID=UPI0029CD85AD|nr:EF-hand domain-containing protein [Actinocorallia sp. A-T 12471]MDX6739806.1 EF-hand domain-containing protein [Actinocorallia sp. A-T 12471]